MRAENNVRLLSADFRQDVIQRQRRERSIGFIGKLARRKNRCVAGQTAGIDDLAPAIAEPAIADHHHIRITDKLAGDRLHAIGAAAGHHRHRSRAIGVAHDP